MANREMKKDRRKDVAREKDQFDSKTVCIRRVTKVVKGGRTMRFSAAVVVGDHNGNVGVGIGKAAEVPSAMDKATKAAKRDLIKVPMSGTTIPHEIIGVFGRARVLMMPAAEGTGVIAGGPVRAVLEAAGVKDIRTKSLGCNNPINGIKATIEGLKSLRTQEQINMLRFSQANVDEKKEG